MNPDTGHLVDLEKMDKKFHEMVIRRSFIKMKEDYIPIPKDLQNAAQKKLAGKPEAFVSRNSGGKLSNFAKQQRFIRAMQRK